MFCLGYLLAQPSESGLVWGLVSFLVVKKGRALVAVWAHAWATMMDESSAERLTTWVSATVTLKAQESGSGLLGLVTVHAWALVTLAFAWDFETVGWWALEELGYALARTSMRATRSGSVRAKSLVTELEWDLE